MVSSDDKRQNCLQAFEEYCDSVFLPHPIEGAYRKFLLHTDIGDIDNTVALINKMELLRKQSAGFGNAMIAFIKEHPTKDTGASVQLLILWKDALGIEDQNFEYYPGIQAFAENVEKFRDKIASHEKIAARNAQNSGQPTTFDIMDYHPKERKAQQPAKKSGSKKNTVFEEQAAIFFAKNPSPEEIDAFLDQFNSMAQPSAYQITNDNESAAEYARIKKNGMYLQSFPLDDPGMQDILAEARVIGTPRHKEDSEIMAEARAKFGIKKPHGAGINSYYNLAYSIPVIKSVDPEQDRITLIFAKDGSTGINASYVSIEMPLSKVIDLVDTEETVSTAKIDLLKKKPDSPQADGMTKKLALAVQSAQMHSKAVLKRISGNDL